LTLVATDYAANPGARASVICNYCARDAAFIAGSNVRERKAECALSILDDSDWRGKAWYLERVPS
jgi:hypothetical protein